MEHEIPSNTGCFKLPTLKSRGWSSGGDELDTFDKAGTLQGDIAEEHDMKEPILNKYKNTINLLSLTSNAYMIICNLDSIWSEATSKTLNGVG